VTLDRVIHITECITRRPLSTNQILFESGKLFMDRWTHACTYVHTYGRTEIETGFTRSTPVRVDLIIITYISSNSPVIFPRLRSQAAVNSTADRCLSSIPRLLDKRPAHVIKQHPANGIVSDDGNMSRKLRAY